MTDREAQIREMAKKTIVLRLPEMDSVAVRRDEAYFVDDEGVLLMDVYTPAAANGAAPPVVVIAIGYPDPQGLFRRFGWHVSWARLLAASGVAAVIYGNRRPAADLPAVLKHVRDRAGTFGLDAGRIGLLACSGHGPVALSTLMQDSKLACAARSSTRSRWISTAPITWRTPRDNMAASTPAPAGPRLICRPACPCCSPAQAETSSPVSTMRWTA